MIQYIYSEFDKIRCTISILLVPPPLKVGISFFFNIPLFTFVASNIVLASRIVLIDVISDGYHQSHVARKPSILADQIKANPNPEVCILLMNIHKLLG